MSCPSSNHNKETEMEERIEILAREMYNRYTDKVGGLAWNGDVLPHSSAFFIDSTKQKQADGWREAARVAIDYVNGLEW